MTARFVITTVQALPLRCRDSTRRRAAVAASLAARARSRGLIQVDPVHVAYVDDAPSVAGAMAAAAAASGVPLTESERVRFERRIGLQVYVGTCPVVAPGLAGTVMQPEGITAGLRELLANGVTAHQIAARTRLSVARIDAIRAELCLPYRSPVLRGAVRELQGAGSR